MIKHIVFFKLPLEFTQKDILAEKLSELKQNIEFIVDLEVGVNFTNSPRAYDVVLSVILNTKDDLKKYSTHEKHLPVIQYIKDNNIDTKVVDYEFVA